MLCAVELILPPCLCKDRGSDVAQLVDAEEFSDLTRHMHAEGPIEVTEFGAAGGNQDIGRLVVVAQSLYVRKSEIEHISGDVDPSRIANVDRTVIGPPLQMDCGPDALLSLQFTSLSQDCALELQCVCVRNGS